MKGEPKPISTLNPLEFDAEDPKPMDETPSEKTNEADCICCMYCCFCLSGIFALILGD